MRSIVQDSCLMVFTVHGICTALGSTYSTRAVHIPYTVITMRQLLHVHVYISSDFLYMVIHVTLVLLMHAFYFNRCIYMYIKLFSACIYMYV